MFTYCRGRNFYTFFIVGLFLFFSCKSDISTGNHNPETIDGMVKIPAGVLEMGGDNEQADANEFPKHNVRIDPFFMDITEVTNVQFKKFVEATGYITVAERKIDWEEMKKTVPPGTPKPPDSVLVPGALVFSKTMGAVALNDPSQWWKWTPGASWKHPVGPESGIEGLEDHPVVQISWEDAKNFCEWQGKRLPTEAEWEWAARGGKKNMIYSWGNEDVNIGRPKANFFQGLFPYDNTVKDGFETTSPVKSFEPNGYGLYDMSGNVWEWCSDWFDFEYYKKARFDSSKKDTGSTSAFNPYMPYQNEKIVRGGSFLCNDSYCSGYRNARRMGSTIDTGLNHTGCRCVKDVVK